MIRLILEAVKEWVEDTLATLVSTLGLTATFNTMPEDNVLLNMANGTVFSTRGYYKKFDGYGGTYQISDTKEPWAKKITGGMTTKYLVVMADSGTPIHTINMGKYGIRPIADSVEFGARTLIASDSASTNEIATYATSNSLILESLMADNVNSWNHNMTFYFGKGRFYFAKPINLTWTLYDSENKPYTRDIAINLVGASEQVRPMAEIFRGTNYSVGTILCFPFLNDGDTAITVGGGTIENVIVYGDKSDYYFHIDRYANIRNEGDSVVNETVGKSIVGISKSGSGFVRNVGVMCFYKGIETTLTNVYVDNIFARNCHTSLSIKNDTKCTRIFGWDVHTLIEVTGSLSSVLQARVDSCINTLKLKGSLSGCTFVDIDGDWCADSLVLIDEDADVKECTFDAIHGRCCTLMAYDKTTTPVKATAFDNFAMSATGYGLIRADGGNFYKNTINITKVSANAYDGDTYKYTPKNGGAEITLTGLLKWVCPIILFCANQKVINGTVQSFNISNNNFTLADTFNSSTPFNQAYFLQRFQTAGINYTRVNVSAGTGFQKGGSAFQIVSYDTLKDLNDRIKALENA